ncbi:MAG: cytochrome c [Candidatus Acidiferrum sp.]
MSAASAKVRGVRKILFVCALALICLSIGLALFHKTPWVVPLADKERKNPLALSEVNINAAKPIYTEKCANCHGDTGKGDGSDAMMYDPAPSDLTDAAKMSKLTDGEIFYQITEGRKPMPSFKKRLTEEQRWQLVLLVRSFAGAPSALPTSKTPAQTNADKSGTPKP